MDDLLVVHQSQLIEAQRRGLANEQRLFALTMFELWRREYRVSI